MEGTASAGESSAGEESSPGTSVDGSASGSESGGSDPGSASASETGVADSGDTSSGGDMGSGDDGSSSSGELLEGWSLVDGACTGMWSIDGFTALPCPTMGMTSGGAIRVDHNFPHPDFPGGVEALVLEPPAGNEVVIQGVFTVGPEITELPNPVFVTDVACVSMGAGECAVELQVRLLRGTEDIQTIVQTYTNGPLDQVIFELDEAQEGDEFILLAINDDDLGTTEGLALIVPWVVES